jgi:hypothetical protein
VSHLGGSVVEGEGEFLLGSLLSEGEEVLSLVESSEVLGVSGSNLSLEVSSLGLDGTGNSKPLVSLSLSLHGSLNSDLSGIDSLSNLAGSDGVLSTDNSSCSLTDVDLGLGVSSSLSGDSSSGLDLSNSLHLSGVLSSLLGEDSSNSGGLGTFDFSDLALSFINSSGSGLCGNSSSDLSVLDGDLLASLGSESSLFLSNSDGVSVHSLLLSGDLKESLSLSFLLLSNSKSEKDIRLEVSSSGPSLLESDSLLSGHLTLEEDLSSVGSVSLSDEVEGSLASLLLLLGDLESLLSHGGDSLLTDVVGLGRAEPVIPLHSVP